MNSVDYAAPAPHSSHLSICLHLLVLVSHEVGACLHCHIPAFRRALRESSENETEYSFFFQVWLMRIGIASNSLN